MTSNGVLTWAIPALPPSGPIDAQWYNAYKFIVKFTDDGAGDGGSRSRTVAVFNSPELDVSRAGGVGTQPDVIYNKDTPIAVDDFLGTPVDAPLVSDVTLGGFTYDLYWHRGDFAPGIETFELVGGGPAHAASFNWNAESGEFTYLPVAGYEGLDSFTYRIDGRYAWSEYYSGDITYSAHNYSNVATVTIQVGKPVRAQLDAEGLVDDLLLIGLSDDYDDVNGNGRVDLGEQAGPPSGEADLIAVDLSYWLRADGYAPDFVAGLQMSHDNIIRLWDSPTKNKEILASVGEHEGDHWLLVDDPSTPAVEEVMPETIWIEPVSTGYTGLTLAIFGRDTSMFTNMVFAGPYPNVDYWTINVTITNFDLTGYRPQTEAYGSPFARTAIPWEKEESPGVYIRRNGDDDNGNNIADRLDIPGPVPNENDLIEVVLSRTNVANVRYVLERTNTGIKVWDSKTKGTEVQFTNNEAVINFGAATSMSLWVEYIATGTTTSSLLSHIEPADLPQNSGHRRWMDQLDFHPFNSVVIVLGGRTQVPSDPTIVDYGTFRTAIDLYRDAYDVHMYNENEVGIGGLDGAGVPYDEVVSAIQKRGVTQVAVFGYSYGGGATYFLALRLELHFPTSLHESVIGHGGLI